MTEKLQKARDYEALHRPETTEIYTLSPTRRSSDLPFTVRNL